MTPPEENPEGSAEFIRLWPTLFMAVTLPGSDAANSTRPSGNIACRATAHLDAPDARKPVGGDDEQDDDTPNCLVEIIFCIVPVDKFCDVL